jgi:hypothetical protein
MKAGTLRKIITQPRSHPVRGLMARRMEAFPPRRGLLTRRKREAAEFHLHRPAKNKAPMPKAFVGGAAHPDTQHMTPFLKLDKKIYNANNGLKKQR